MLKVATKHAEQLFVDVGKFRMLIAGFARQLKETQVGREHLIHRMAEGLEKMVQMLGGEKRGRQARGGGSGQGQFQPKQENTYSNMALDSIRNASVSNLTHNNQANLINGGNGINSATNAAMNQTISPTQAHSQPNTQFDAMLDPATNMPFDFGDSAIELGMSFFDFEGTTLEPETGQQVLYEPSFVP